MLRERFSLDEIHPVPKGEFGGDVLQKVVGPVGQHCGTMLWEFKRTKNWSDGWLPKLRDDQRTAKAEVAIIVSNTLPKGVQTFDYTDGVWITDVRCAIPVAIALRQSLIEIASARTSVEGQLPPVRGQGPRALIRPRSQARCGLTIQLLPLPDSGTEHALLVQIPYLPKNTLGFRAYCAKPVAGESCRSSVSGSSASMS
jgi:hypothetical protein